jgi:NTP pyrophosphatase (non-canonical NTP hydrolase)
MIMMVYIASPYTEGEGQFNNVRTNIIACDKIRELGVRPFSPLLFAFWHLVYPHPYEYWMDLCLEWVKDCDALLRLPGKSQGADDEVAEATALGIPVFYSIHDLKEWLDEGQLKEKANQRSVARLYKDIGDKWKMPTPMDAWAFLVGETGELGDVMMRLGHGQCDDYSRNHEFAPTIRDLEHELGDTFLMLCALANSLGLNLEGALAGRIAHFYAKYQGD